MENQETLSELLNSLEHIVFRDKNAQAMPPRTPNVLTEFEQLRQSTDLKIDDFACAMGVSVSLVREWESRRVKPSPTELKLMRLMQANPVLSKHLINN